jgi:hypothetical protein
MRGGVLALVPGRPLMMELMCVMLYPCFRWGRRPERGFVPGPLEQVLRPVGKSLDAALTVSCLAKRTLFVH